MNTSILASSLLAIAASNVEGFTVDTKTLQPVTSGYAVAVAETQNSFGVEGLNKVIKYVNTHNNINAFGGWLNTDNNQFYFDATIVCRTKKEAEALARANNQIAYFDLANLEEIRIK